jgi:hypothetical protein
MRLTKNTTLRWRLTKSHLATSVSICLLLVSGTAIAKATQSSAPPGSDSNTISETVSRNFGSGVEVVATFHPYQVTGDFNGDRVQDLAVVVRITGSRSLLPKDVKLLNPFEQGGAIHFPQNAENRLALAIVHSWNSPVASGKYLLLGESPVLVLQYARAISSQESDRNGLLGLRSKAVKRRGSAPLPPTAKGDVILLGTEVGGDSLLYWNGRTYRWEDSAED